MEDLYKKYGPLVRQDLGTGTVIHIFDPEDIRTVYINEGTMPHVVPLQETAQLYRQTRDMSPGLGNAWVYICNECGKQNSKKYFHSMYKIIAHSWHIKQKYWFIIHGVNSFKIRII